MNPIRRKALTVAVLCCAVASALMSGLFASTLADWWVASVLMAAVGASGTVIWASCAIAIRYFWDRREYVSVGAMAILALIVGLWDFTSNFGSLSWQRTSTVIQADFQRTAYTDARKTVTDNEDWIKSLRHIVTRLEQESTWLPSRPPSSFDAPIQAAALAVKLEASRGGCGPVCETRTRELAELRAKQAMAVSYVEKKAEIARLQKVIEDSRDRSLSAPPPKSGAVLQSENLASLATVSLVPHADAVQWANKLTALLAAILLCVGLPLAQYLMAYGLPSGPEPSGNQNAGVDELSVNTHTPPPLTQLPVAKIQAPQPRGESDNRDDYGYSARVPSLPGKPGDHLRLRDIDNLRSDIDVLGDVRGALARIRQSVEPLAN